MRYEIFGLALDCDTPLPELPASRRQSVDLAASLKGTAPVGGPWRWVREWTREDGSAWLRFGRRACSRSRPGLRNADEWLLRLPQLADFLVTGGARVIRGRAAHGVPTRTLRHLLIDHIVPIVLSARGHLLLHASGICTPAGAILFAGSSGSGKSTLAYLLGADTHDWQPLADDVVRIEAADGRARATPDYPGARLWPDVLAITKPGARLPRIAHYSDKRRLTAASVSRNGCRAATVSRVLLIDDGTPAAEAIELRPLTPQEAFVALVPHIYRLDADDPTIARAQFDALSKFCAAVPARSLAFPRRFDRLDAIRHAIALDLGARS